MSAAEFPHGEREIADALGVQKKSLREVRADELERGTDWETVGSEVRYSDAGKARLLVLLKIAPEASPPPPVTSATEVALSPAVERSPEKISAAAPAVRNAGDIEDLTCLKCYAPNRRVLEAKTAAGELVLVRLKDNRNLQPGMVMKCRFAEGRMWELAQRLPRFRGKW